MYNFYFYTSKHYIFYNIKIIVYNLNIKQNNQLIVKILKLLAKYV